MMDCWTAPNLPRIRKIDMFSGTTTLAFPSFNGGDFLAIDKAEAFVLVTSISDRVIRKVDLATGQNMTVAGGGSTVDGGIGM